MKTFTQKEKETKCVCKQTWNFFKNDRKDLNKKFNVEMFSIKIRGGKGFAAEQNIQELKKRLSKLNLIKSKSVTPNKLISKSTANMNEIARGKYSLSPNYIKRQLLQSESSRLRYNFDRTKAVSKLHKYLDKYDVSLYSRKKRYLDLI